MSSAQSELSSGSLVKSKELLDRITHKISGIESNRENMKVIKSIQNSSKKMQQTIDHRIEQDFSSILHAPTLMPLASLKAHTEKEINLSSSFNAVDGAKALMHHYWQRNNKGRESKAKENLSKTLGGKRSSSTLPQITDYKLAVFIKSKEKEKEFGHFLKPEAVEEQFHTIIEIVDYCCQNDTKAYAKFQRRYYKRWAEIESILKALQKFAMHYSILLISVDTLKVFELIDRVRQGQKINPHHLLRCCLEPEKISDEHFDKPGIRFYGKNGYVRAVVVLQSHFRRWMQVRKYRRMKLQDRSARKIQAHFGCWSSYRRTKALIYDRQMQKIADFKMIQEEFAKNYRKNQLTSPVKYEIHIPSHNYSEWQKVSSSNYLEKQNSEICRIFKVAEKSHLTKTHIIYITPLGLSKEIISYYRKLLELGSEESLHHRLSFISPDFSNCCPMNMALTQQLYYSPRALKKIRSIIGSNYAFIVPSSPSNDYIHLCTELKVPLYSSFPQQLQFIQSKSGCKSIQQSISQSGDEKEEFGVLPYSIDIYNQLSLLNELTNMIYQYPQVRRWVLKIDSESSSRGVAVVDTSKLVGKRLLGRAAEEAAKSTSQLHQKQCREEIYSLLENSLIVNRQERIIPLDQCIYPTQEEFLKHYYTRGGILEASINNFEADLENSCFTVNLEPDGQWRLLTSFYKITNKNKAVACYFDSSMAQPLSKLEQIVRVLKGKSMFGYFTFQFLAAGEMARKETTTTSSRCYYLNSIECHLNEFSSAYLLRDFISKGSNALFVPILQHPCLKELRLQTFFHLCRLQNISFDIESKVGNVFMFLNGLESGCIGIMTFNPHSKAHCYSHAGEVLEFLNSKMKQTALKSVPSSFLALKNAINGYLNRTRRNAHPPRRSG